MRSNTPLIIFTLIALAVLAGGGALQWRKGALDARLSSAEGEVVSITSAYVNGERRYEATIQWKDAQGTARFLTAYAQSGGTYVEGQKIALRYHPSHPEEAHAAGGVSFGGAFLGVIGAVFLFISIKQWSQILRKKA